MPPSFQRKGARGSVAMRAGDAAPHINADPRRQPTTQSFKSFSIPLILVHNSAPLDGRSAR